MSFLDTNSEWFNGDIVIYYAKEDKRLFELLRTIYPNTVFKKFHFPRMLPRLSYSYWRFSKMVLARIEALSLLRYYDVMIGVDFDVVFVKSIFPAILNNKQISALGDHGHLLKDHYFRIGKMEQQYQDRQAFSMGFYIIDGSLHGLLDLNEMYNYYSSRCFDIRMPEQSCFNYFQLYKNLNVEYLGQEYASRKLDQDTVIFHSNPDTKFWEYMDTKWKKFYDEYLLLGGKPLQTKVFERSKNRRKLAQYLHLVQNKLERHTNQITTLLKTTLFVIRHWLRFGKSMAKSGIASLSYPRMVKIDYKSDFLGCTLDLFCLDNDDFANMARNGQLDNWEYAELKAFHARCRDETVLVDCGASIGLYSRIALLANPHNKVQSFEPNPWTRHALVKNLEQFRFNAKVFHYALGDMNGRGELIVPRDNLFTSSAKLEDYDSINSRIWYKGINVEVRTLDFLVENGEIEAPNVLKMDVEGFELNILEGARRLLESHKPTVFFEALDEVRLQEITSYLSRYGYVVHAYEVDSVRNFVAI